MSAQDGVPQTPSVAKSLVLGGVAGVVGVTTVYPLDLVKTLLQNQRGGVRYDGFSDCFKQRVKAMGVPGLYSGLGANLIGVTPEKALKLAANSHARLYFGCRDNEFRLNGELAAGAVAAIVQFVATNPMEIVKIRLQVANRAGGPKVGMMEVLKELGVRGLYKGGAATLLRDIPFSMIYFPLYSYLKLQARDAKTHKTPFQYLFMAGTAAGVTAAFLTTPFDVIKTRLQAKAVEGERTYTGIGQCARSILEHEGATSFFKGVGPRVSIIGPLFGIALLVYEQLGDLF